MSMSRSLSFFNEIDPQSPEWIRYQDLIVKTKVDFAQIYSEYELISNVIIDLCKDDIIPKLTKFRKHTNIWRIVGSSIGLVGGTALAVALIGPTFGASTILILTGGIGGIGGGALAGGASVTEAVLQSRGTKDLRTLSQELNNEREKLAEAARNLHLLLLQSVHFVMPKLKHSQDKNVSEVLRSAGQFSLGALGAGVAVGRILASSLDDAVMAGTRIGAAGTRVALNLTLATVGAVIDVYTIVDSALSLAKGNNPKAVQKLKQLVEDLSSSNEQLKQLIERADDIVRGNKTAILKEAADFYRCCICASVSQIPIVLCQAQCQGLIGCQNCIKQVIENQNTKGQKVTCPLCRGIWADDYEKLKYLEISENEKEFLEELRLVDDTKSYSLLHE